ncbi:GntR family transcriptional regulator [Streptomyces sp. NPDC001515]
MSTVPPRIPAPGNPSRSGHPDPTAALLRTRIQAGTYAPGTRITLTELGTVIEAPRSRLREALDQLAAEGLITASAGLWKCPDHRPPDHSVARSHRLLASMIDHGAYPAGIALPTRHLLATILTTDDPADVRGALHRLADDRVIQLAGHARPRVLAAPPGVPARAAWPPAPDSVQDALPTAFLPGADSDRVTLGRAACAARARVRWGISPAPDILTDQELRIAYVVRVLVTRAYEKTAGTDTGVLPKVRSAAARVMACHALPPGEPHERQFRLAVLATALRDLVDALPRPRTRGWPDSPFTADIWSTHVY